jgi:hypothetical protein
MWPSLHCICGGVVLFSPFSFWKLGCALLHTCRRVLYRMSRVEACCTCATLLSDTKVPYDTETEKPICLDRRLECCSRTICATCQYKNSRFQTYCPFCQISSEPTALPSTGLRLPPSYASTSTSLGEDLPPPYASVSALSVNRSYPPETEDVIHFLNAEDTMSSLSLSYRVPVPVLREHNKVHSDPLLAARKWVLIPKSHYNGPPLSTPPDPEEEERKNKLRRWMIATKCPDYNIATLYLKGSDYNLEVATEFFKADERWEKDHPMKGKGRARNRQSGSLGLSSQLSS